MLTIIPAKPFKASKTRLATVLSPTERADLTRHLLVRTIDVAAEISQVLVVSRDERVAEVAKKAGAWVLPEQGANLNMAVSQGIAWAKANEFTPVLILPLDLPHLTVAELKSLVDLGQQTCPNIVIAPCQHNTGTNALFLNPPDLIVPQFGPDSFAAHQAAAQASGISAHIYRSPGLAFDLDTPDDWWAFVSCVPLESCQHSC